MILPTSNRLLLIIGNFIQKILNHVIILILTQPVEKPHGETQLSMYVHGVPKKAEH